MLETNKQTKTSNKIKQVLLRRGPKFNGTQMSNDAKSTLESKSSAWLAAWGASRARGGGGAGRAAGS